MTKMRSPTIPFSSMLSSDPQNLSVPYMISYLKSSFLESDFDEVEKILALREENLKKEMDEMKTNFEKIISRLKYEKMPMGEREISVEEERYQKLFAKEIEKSERDKKCLKMGKGTAESEVEELRKLLEEVRKSEQEKLEEIELLVRKKKCLEMEKAKANAEFYECKKLLQGLQERVLVLEEDLKPWISKGNGLNRENGGRAKRNGSLQQDAGRQSVDLATEYSSVKIESHVEKLVPNDTIHISDSDDADDEMTIADGLNLKRKRASSESLSVKESVHDDCGYSLTKKFKTKAFKDIMPANHYPSCQNDQKSITSCRKMMTAVGKCEEKLESESKKHKLPVVLHDAGDSDDSSCNSRMNELIAECRRSRMGKKLEFEADLLYAFDKDDELCMKAVCALYRRHIKLNHGSLLPGHRGFTRSVSRGMALGEFLVDGDPNGRMKKSVAELKQHDPEGLDACRFLAKEQSKQLFQMYERNEDPLFP